MGVHLFGVRHHGPGCARSLRAALERLAPDIVLVEGPPDAEAALPLMMSEAMQPPVALLIYAPDQPQRAVYYPFTTFSPEWQALRYAFERHIPARFMDLPQAIQLAREPEASPDGEAAVDGAPAAGAEAPEAADATSPSPLPLPDTGEGHAQPDGQAREGADDPIGMLSAAAGYDDHEAWWEIQVEQRRHSVDLFEGILEAMTALRSDLTPRNDEEAQREAHMRQTIRAAVAEGHTRIAVVCGAWHAPALADLTPSPFPHLVGRGVESAARPAGDATTARNAARPAGDATPPNSLPLPDTGEGNAQAAGQAREGADAAILKGLKRVKVEATWIPWTNSRLAYRSGYGAGVTSPGWYEHLWTAPDRISIRWLTSVAHTLRGEGLDTSSASVIEAVRLADALAAMRDLPMPGLPELHEATLTVLCNGEEAPLRLIREKVEIGERMGAVPPETPAVPLQRDLESLVRRLGLKLSGEIEQRDLDLRKDRDRARSQLFHRLSLLGVPWAKPTRSMVSAKGTFHEFWQTKWEPEFHIKLIEANIWGNTVQIATSAYARDLADHSDELPQLTRLLDRVILAELPDALDHLLDRVETRSAVTADVQHLLDALPPLVQVTRYTDVRETKAERILPVIDALFTRAIIGLPGACSSLDDDAARSMVGSLNHAEDSVNLLRRDDYSASWHATLRGLIARDNIHGLVRGRCCRLLLEHNAMDDAELQRLAGLALSTATPTEQAAAWVEGVVHGSGVILLSQHGLWVALDHWLSDLDAETFVAVLPLLRRAFSEFEGPERRKMGEKVKSLRSEGAFVTVGVTATGDDIPLNRERADAVLPVLAQILGVDDHATEITEAERLKRWRLALGADAQQGLGMPSDGLGGADREMDAALAALYGGEGDGGDSGKSKRRSAGLGGSAPNVARWLGDIRTYFPTSAVKLMQQDALTRLNLTQLLLEPELLAEVEPDVHLVANLISLGKVIIPEQTKDTARQVVRRVVDDLERRLAAPLTQAIRGSLSRATRTNRPRANEINWDRTIRANLKNYLPDHGTIIAERLIGYGHKRSALRDIVLCVDQSGSMASSLVYSGIFGAVMASIRAVSTRMVVFDTAVVDLTDDLQDPVDLLFGVQLGGGTDINRALAYCQEVIARPAQTILILITDLYEGGNAQEMLRRAAELAASGVQMVCLLALSDDGAPGYDRRNAATLASLGVPSFACTPDLFPELMAAAIQRQDLGQWAARYDIVAARAEEA